jgi:hypothetical protein
MLNSQRDSFLISFPKKQFKKSCETFLTYPIKKKVKIYMSDVPAIIMDNGSGVTKAGFSGDDSPISIFPTLLGFQKKESEKNEYFVGDLAMSKRGILSLKYPIERGKIINWDNMVLTLPFKNRKKFGTTLSIMN